MTFKNILDYTLTLKHFQEGQQQGPMKRTPVPLLMLLELMIEMTTFYHPVMLREIRMILVALLNPVTSMMMMMFVVALHSALPSMKERGSL